MYIYCHATNIQQPQCLRVFTSASRDTTNKNRASLTSEGNMSCLLCQQISRKSGRVWYSNLHSAQKAVKCCISPDISLSLDSLRLVPHSKTGPGPTGTIQSYKTTSRIKGFIVVQLTTHWLTPEINIFMHYNVITGNAKYIIHNKEMIMFGLSWFV